ncbi:MAG TPA: copper resistance protein CopC [Candidatus Limnocylindrales bacterium]|nr:copper resistance protein CopC [Candidatus Limnocylindrales bacterium]
MTSRSGGRRLILVAAAVAVLAAFPATAFAHAELVRAIPADGSTVTEPVTVVSARYSQDLTSASSLNVLDASGATVANGGVDSGDSRRMLARPDVPFTNGTYTVKSTSISAEDGDIERLTWTFTVEVAATPAPTPGPTVGASAPATSSPTPEATPSAAPSASSSPTPSAEPGEPTSSTTDALLPIVAALALVLVLAGFLLNRSRAGR